MSPTGRALLAVAVAAAAALAGCTSTGSGPRTGGTASPSAPAASTVYDIAYANKSPAEKLDLYLPSPAANPAPLVVWVHGGGWRTGTKNAIAQGYDPSAPPPPEPPRCGVNTQIQTPDVRGLNANGYAVAAIDYRLDQDPVAALKDAKAAVRFLRANAAKYHLDPEKFAAWGDSAGGYTVIMLGVTSGTATEFDDPALADPVVSADVQAVIDWFGPTDAGNMPGKLRPAELPYAYIKTGHRLPPFLIAHGTGDCIVPVQSSRHLHDALTRAGDQATLHLLPGAQHEDPAFMRTQLTPTYAFLAATFGQ
jgi:acetyl esterase/lipase